MAAQTMQLQEESAIPILTMIATPDSSPFQTRTLRFHNGPIKIGRTDGLDELGGEVVVTSSNGIFTEKVVSRKHGKLTFENGRFFVVDLNSSHGTQVNGVKLPKNTPTKLKNDDIVTFGRAGFCNGIEFKPIIARIKLDFPSYDSIVPDSVNQMSKKQEEVAEDLNKTLSLESLIVALQNEDKRSPNTERKLSGLKQALEYKKWCNFSTKEAVAHVPMLSNLSPGNSPGH